MATSKNPIAIVHVTKTMFYLDDSPKNCYDVPCYSLEELNDLEDKLFYESECCDTCIRTNWNIEELIEGAVYDEFGIRI